MVHENALQYNKHSNHKYHLYTHIQGEMYMTWISLNMQREGEGGREREI